MSHGDVEESGDFSVKEFFIFLYNQRNNHEISMVKNIKKRMLSGILFFLLT